MQTSKAQPMMALWGKKSETKDGGDLADCLWLPLMIHLEDTMQVADHLWSDWIPQGEKEYLASQVQSGKVDMARRIFMLLCGLHDIGKATPCFQTKKGYSSTMLNDALLDKLEKAGFAGIRNVTLANRDKTGHEVMGAAILTQMGFHDDVAGIVAGHHGWTVSYDGQIEAYQKHYNQEYGSTAVARLWQSTRNDICTYILKQCGFRDASDIPTMSQTAQVILCGHVIMADWIASNEAYFPLIGLDDAIPDEKDVLERGRHGFQKWRHASCIQVQIPHDAKRLYERRFGFLPRSFQETIFNTVAQIKDPGLVIIEAPTGSGKTEAALATAEQLMADKHVSGLYFGLPTQATANGNFGRTSAWLKSFASDYGVPQSLHLYHGKAMLNPLMAELADGSIDDFDDTHDYGSRSHRPVFVNQWFSGSKKTPLDDCVVGTVDQFLKVGQQQKHLMLRHIGFTRKVVIIDEVHAYDAYMQQYLTRALMWMGAYRVPVILLSATLPSYLRESFVNSYLAGLKMVSGRPVKLAADLQTQTYPVLTYTDGMCMLQKTDFEPMKQHDVYIKKIAGDDCVAKVADMFRKHPGEIGIIVNTIKRAQKLTTELTAIFGSDQVQLLHSSFIATDRADKENRLLSIIGKQGIRQPMILIGTQVLEQSLDIDFDVLFTDFCPIDLLIQRIGRLHRHYRADRNTAYKDAVVYVMDAAGEFEAGTKKIYQEYILECTQHFLPEKITIPQDVSRLVQNVYGFIYDVPDNSRQDMEDHIYNEQQKAHAFLLDMPDMDASLTDWIRRPNLAASDQNDHGSAVRDIAETFEVIALRQYGEDYGLMSPHSQSEKHLSVIHTESEARLIAEQTLRLRKYISDKISVEHLQTYTANHFHGWSSQKLLRHAYGLLFDKDGKLIDTDMLGLKGLQVYYDRSLGLFWKNA